jgi:colanic acid/amylovoran biosynthesis glycosyltransferase
MEKLPRLVYIIGTFPGLSKTFIEQEIRILRQWGVVLQPVSIRRPSASDLLSAEQRKLQRDTIYLLPVGWLNSIKGNLYFVLSRPLVYFKTLIYLLSRPHPSTVDRFKTFLHFGEGVWTAYTLRRQPPDQFHAHFVDRAATVALVAGRLLGTPFSITAHANSIYQKRVLLCEKLGEARFVITVSEFNKSYLLDTCPALDPEKVYVLHPWVDLSRFRPSTTCPAHDMLHILSVGRLVEKKGHKYLIEACHILNEKSIDFECRIIGDGPLRTELETEIERYNLKEQVHLLGGQPHDEVLSNLKWSDVFVLACVIAEDGDRDGMPVALAEAMAMAVPVVSCDIVGIGELVRPGTGLLVPPRDAAALADALQTLHAAGEFGRAEMGRRGRSVVGAEFDLHEGIRQLKVLFHNACEN